VDGADQSPAEAYDSWRAEMRVQNDYLRRQIQALRHGPRARWRKFRLLEVVCGRCGDLLVEVMDTDPFPTLLSRRPVQHPDTPSPSDSATTQERIAILKQSKPSIRRDDGWRLTPISANFKPASDESAGSALVIAVCSCRQVEVTEALIFDDLSQGRRKRIIPAP